MPALRQSDRQPLHIPRLGAAPGAVPTSTLDQQMLEHIGQRLHAAYDATMNDPLPVRLADLVERLARRESGGE